MKITKETLFDFARFLFRSGEISFSETQSWAYSKSIDSYIQDTWVKFLKNQKEQGRIKFKKFEEVL